MRKVECLNNGFVFKNVEAAAKYYGVKVKRLQKHLEGKRPYAGKGEAKELMFWQYAEDNAKVWNRDYIEDDWYNDYMAM